MAHPRPVRAALIVGLLFFLGLAVTLVAFVDLQWTHGLFVKGSAAEKPAANVDPTKLQSLRQSILNVRVQCVAGVNTGTGFVVKPGFVATAAHVLGDRQMCSGPILLIDHKGLEHTATVEAISSGDDLALLRLPDSVLPALKLADTTRYEAADDVVRLVTIGYPLEDAGASSRDRASLSGEGSLSRFIRDQNVFVTSGLNLNPGNSGGPIFVRDDWTVLGIARAKLPNSVGDGIGFVASIRAFETFFRENTGQELR
ncbi:MAG TPA: serine protease [Thermoanaerobaculia bacterium]|jgi:S1-C subfamily serine protease